MSDYDELLNRLEYLEFECSQRDKIWDLKLAQHREYVENFVTFMLTGVVACIIFCPF